MSERGDSNFVSFLEHTSPDVPVNFHSLGRLGSSEEEVRKPYVSLTDIWYAYQEWGTYARGVPITLKNYTRTKVTQYYVPTLSAIQIFTNKPFVGGSSSRSVVADCPLYFEYNETSVLEDRLPLLAKVDELAEQHHGLYTLNSSDLSRQSWFAVAWVPLYQIPEAEIVKPLSVSFLTYHSLTPFFPETFPEDAKVELPTFGAVTSKLSGEVWVRPGTSDEENINMHEESASSWLGKLMFKHRDFDLYKAEKSSALPLPSGR